MVAFVGVVTLVSLAVSMLVPAIVLYVVYKRLASGQATLVMSGPLAHALVASAASQDTGNDGMVKRCTCPACGAPKQLPSRSAYVFCDRCGQLMDWDFKAALADKRSRQPGPAYVQLVSAKQPALDAARTAGDVEAYTELQRAIYSAYVQACPAAVSPRIGDPAYREAFVEWSARSQAAQDLDPTCRHTFLEQQAATAGLVWDRSNPFQPRAEPASFQRLLEAVLIHQATVLAHLESTGLLAEHPDRPTAEVFGKIGRSAMVQGWVPYLPAADQPDLIERTGLQGDYAAIEPVDLTSGSCAGCASPLEVVPGAQRVVCLSCGRMASVGGGTLPCHGCGASVTVPPDEPRFSCPYCDVELLRMRL